MCLTFPSFHPKLNTTGVHEGYLVQVSSACLGLALDRWAAAEACGS